MSAAVPPPAVPPTPEVKPEWTYLILDLWQALGCPVEQFDGYVERNGPADTWAALLAAVRNPGRCLRPVDGDPSDLCVLAPHSETSPCYGAGDVGSTELLPLPIDTWAADFRRVLEES